MDKKTKKEIDELNKQIQNKRKKSSRYNMN